MITRRIGGLLFATGWLVAASAAANAAIRSDLAETVRTADDLYGDGRDPARLHQALDLLDGAINTQPPTYDLLWRTSRALYQLADIAQPSEKRVLLDRAVELGQRAVAAAPDRVEGHYWLGASDGSSAEIRGAFKALSLVSKLRDEMEAVVRMQPCYEGGDAFRALGELDLQLPWIVGGRKSRAVRRLEEGVQACPANLELQLSLAGGYLETGRKDEGRRLLERIAMQSDDPTASDRDIRQRAAKRLANLH
jgi:hypothetical protein